MCSSLIKVVRHSQDGTKTQVRKNSLNIKFLGGIFLGHPGPRRRDIPDKNFMQVAYFCCFRQGVAGMSRDLGRDVPDLEKLYARKLWADFSYPKDLEFQEIRTPFGIQSYTPSIRRSPRASIGRCKFKSKKDSRKKWMPLHRDFLVPEA